MARVSAPRAAPGTALRATPDAAPCSAPSTAPSTAPHYVVRVPPHRRRRGRRVRKRHTQRPRLHVDHGVVSEAVLAVLLGCARLLALRAKITEGARRRWALRVESQVAQARVPRCMCMCMCLCMCICAS